MKKYQIKIQNDSHIVTAKNQTLALKPLLECFGNLTAGTWLKCIGSINIVDISSRTGKVSK